MKDRKFKKDSTINDIAEALGVSAATVSRALNDHDDISEQTKKRVRKVARDLGYRRNRIASGLRQQKSNTIGVIVPVFTALFHSTIITSIQNKLHDHGYNLILCHSNESYDLEKQLTDTLYSYRVDGLIVALTSRTTDYDHFKTFVDRGIPLLFYDRVPTTEFPAHYVVSDDFRGGYLAGSHLLEVGARNPAFICGLQTCNLYIDRNAGFREALRQGGMELDEDCVFYQELTHENAWEACRRIFRDRKNHPDSVFTANDTSALAVLKYAREQGLKVPDNLKIIGYSNDPRSEIVDPPITTIDQNIQTMAQAVADRIIALIDGDINIATRIGKSQSEIIGVNLIRRMST